MEGFGNYENLLGQSRNNDMYSINQKNSMKSNLQQQIEEKKAKILSATEGLSMPLVVEGGRGILKGVFQKTVKKVVDKAVEKGGETAEGAVKEAGAMVDDFSKGGVKGVIKGTSKRLQQRIKDKADQQNKQQSQKNLGDNDEDAGADEIGNFMKGKPKLDDDIVGDLTKGAKEPNLSDYKNAVKKQLKRNIEEEGEGDAEDEAGGFVKSVVGSLSDKLKALKSLGTDTMKGVKDATKLGDNLAEDGTIKVKTFAKAIKDASKVSQKVSKTAQSERYAQQKEAFRELSPENQADYKNEYNAIKNAQKGRINPKDPLTDDNLDLHDNLLDKYQTIENETPPKTTEPPEPTEPSGDDDLKPKTSGEDDLPTEPTQPKAPLEEDGEGKVAGEGEEEGETLGKKLAKTGEKMVEEDAEGGGLDDPFADLISLATGVAGLFSGLLGSHHKPVAPTQAVMANVSSQIGVD